MENQNISEVIIYNDGEIELNVSFDSDTIWLTQNQLVELFEVTKQNISSHIIGIYKDKELDKDSTVKKYLIVQKEGNREVKRNLEHYNLDMIISVGYRINSLKATKFRKWATSILKTYITNGYVINSEKITHQRFKELENDIVLLKSEVKNISNKIEDKSTHPKQGIFYDGQVYDAYIFVSNLIKSAKNNIVLIDNYIDDSILTLLSKRDENISCTIYTKNISKQLKLDLEKYNTQYSKIEIKKFDDSHDRFLILDKKEVYHIGASLKDLGKKWFGFSKFDIKAFDILSKLEKTKIS